MTTINTPETVGLPPNWGKVTFARRRKSTINVRFGIMARLRILFGKPFVIQIINNTTEDPGYTEVSYAVSPSPKEILAELARRIEEEDLTL